MPSKIQYSQRNIWRHPQYVHALYQNTVSSLICSDRHFALRHSDHDQSGAIITLSNGKVFQVIGNSADSWKKAGNELYEYLTNNSDGEAFVRAHKIASDLKGLEDACKK